MAKRKFEVGGTILYEFPIVLVDHGKVVVEFPDRTRKALSPDDQNIVKVAPMPKIGGNRKLSEPD